MWCPKDLIDRRKTSLKTCKKTYRGKLKKKHMRKIEKTEQSRIDMEAQVCLIHSPTPEPVPRLLDPTLLHLKGGAYMKNIISDFQKQKSNISTPQSKNTKISMSKAKKIEFT